MSNYKWWKQYEDVAEVLLEAGMPGAADDILTLVDGLKCWERDGKELRRRAEAAEDALVAARKALKATRDSASSWNIGDEVRTARIQHYVDPILADLFVGDTPGKENDG